MSPYTLRSIVLALFILSYPLVFSAQDTDIKQSVSSDFEMILLDGKDAYLHRINKKIYTAEQYRDLLKGKVVSEPNESVKSSSFSTSVMSEAYWDTLKVNPYKGYKLDQPFEITFDDLDCASPIDRKIVVTSRFGRRRRGPHRGIDLDLVTGDNVRTILPGKVRFVGYSSGHGRTVVVRHDNNVETVYAHLSSYDVKTNDYVTKGQILGKGGTSGNARGSHLHFEMRYMGTCIHPEYLIDFSGTPKIRSNKMWVTKGGINPLNHSSYVASKIPVFETKELALEGQKNERKIHVVKKGDTLWGIARRNGMRVKDLVAMNKKVSTKSTLRIGQHLVISP